MTTVTVGQVSISRIEEMYTAGWDAPAFFPDWRPDAVAQHLSWMVPHHFDAARNSLKLSMHSWLLRIGRRTVLIDTCIGNQKERPSRPEWHRIETPYLARLAEAGVRPEEIDMVMCTHLHADHVGWNTRLENGRWVPTFPNARYVFSKADYDHYLKEERAGREPNRGSFRDSVLPVVEAGRAAMVDGDETLDEHLSLERAPGHTPGSVLVKLASAGKRAIFCGDVLHHAIQVYHPDWNSFVCADAALARTSRRKVLEQCSGSGALLMPAHFGAPFACHIEAKGTGFVPRFLGA